MVCAQEILAVFLVTAVLGIVIPNTNMYAMANRMPSNILAIVINISPLIIYPLALLFHLEKFWWVRFLAFCWVYLALCWLFCLTRIFNESFYFVDPFGVNNTI